MINNTQTKKISIFRKQFPNFWIEVLIFMIVFGCAYFLVKDINSNNNSYSIDYYEDDNIKENRSGLNYKFEYAPNIYGRDLEIYK